MSCFLRVLSALLVKSSITDVCMYCFIIYAVTYTHSHTHTHTHTHTTHTIELVDQFSTSLDLDSFNYVFTHYSKKTLPQRS